MRNLVIGSPRNLPETQLIGGMPGNRLIWDDGRWVLIIRRRDMMTREEEIKLIAYRLWEEEGCCDGRDFDYWLRAEFLWEAQKKEQVSPGNQESTPEENRAKPKSVKRKASPKRSVRKKPETSD
jgi:hypothetical protein